MRRPALTKALAAVAFGIIAALLFAGPASAVEPPPAPVDEILDVPSRTVRSLPTSGGGIADKTAVDMWRLFSALFKGSATAPPVPIVNLPKPITPAAAVARSGAGAAGVLTAFQVGWAVGQGGLATYALATGSSYETMSCNNPGWYQGLNSFIMLGITPDCDAIAVHANTDVNTAPVLTYSGTSIRFVGQSGFISSIAGTGTVPAGQPYNWCVSAKAPAGTYLEAKTTDRRPTHVWNFANPVNGGGNTYYGCAVGQFELSGAYNGGDGPTGVLAILRLVSSTSGSVVASQTTPNANPSRTPDCKLHYPDGSTATGHGPAYTDTGGIPLGLDSLGCKTPWDAKPGVLPDRIEVGTTDEQGIRTVISDQEVPEYTPDQQKGLTAPANGHGLVLERLVNGGWLSCMTWDADCANWWSDTDEGTTTGTYRCTYGGASIALVECGPYRQTFDTRTSTPTITDPVTGDQVEWGSTPQTGNSLNPGVGPGVSPGDACFASGWASVANPIDWVLVPVKCALVWAFVPRTTAVEGTVSALGESAGSVAAVDPLMALLDTLPASGGCAGIPIELTFFGKTATGNLLGACDGFGATAAAVVNGLLTLSIATGALIAVTRYAAAVFGFVGPGGGIQQQEYSNHMMARSAARSD